MYIRPRHAVRAGMIAGLALTALPIAPGVRGGSWAPHASAAPYSAAGLTPSLIAQAGKQPVNVILLLRHGASAQMLRTLRSAGASNISTLDIIDGIAARVSARTLEALQGNTDLNAIGLDHSYKIYPSPEAEQLNQQLAQAGLQQVPQAPAGQTVVSEPDTLSLIHADTVQNQYNGRGVRVAILDSGIDLGQPDLKGVVATGPDGKPLYADFSGTDFTDTVGHGTAVAGTIAAQARTVYTVNDTYRALVYPPAKPGQRFDDKTYFTFSGVAPGVKLLVAKILDHRAPFSFTTDSNLVRAIGWAVQNHADVISESWGTNFPFVTDGVDAVAMADEAAVHAGVTVVAANGNAGPGEGTLGSPATAPDVIAAGASTDLRQDAETGFFTAYGKYSSDNIAYFTSHGPTSDGRIRPDVYAPGDSAWATYPRNPSDDSPTSPPYTIGAFGGTSQATPVIAGTAALVINAYEETHHRQRPSPAYVKQVILSTADDLGYPAADQGAGRINALRAVQAITHQGPSLLFSGSLALSGLPGQKLSHPITVTNSGSTPEQVTFKTRVLHQTKALSFGGTVIADNLFTFQFDVPWGVNKLSASLNFDSQATIPLPSPQKPANLALRVVLYDPADNMVNYGYSRQSGSGFTLTTAAHPTPGRWTAVVSQVRAKDKKQVRHYINVAFKGHITMGTFFTQPANVTPSKLTLKPGQTAHLTFTSDRLTAPGVTVVTLQAREHSLAPAPIGTTTTDAVATIPVVLTTDIPIKNSFGLFGGTFTGGVGDQGFATETKYFTFTAPANAHTLQVSIAWQHPGNWFWVTLIDPRGKVINVEDNALINPSDLSAPPDLSQRTIDSYLNNPLPGRWRITLLNFTPAGLYPAEQFRGAVVLDQPFAQLNHPSVTAMAGGDAVPFSIKVHNTGLGIEGYLTYATTDHYQYMALGGTGGALQDGPLGAASTQVMTYTTAFVPPGTRELISQAQALNSNTPVDVQLDDSQVDTYQSFGVPAPVALDGQPGVGTVAAVRDRALPAGFWSVQLSVPGYKDTKPIYVAANTVGYALAPQPWITMNAQYGKNVTINPNGLYNGNLAAALPNGLTTIKGTVQVPDGVAPGTYHAHLFVLTSLFDQLADLPLTITVSGVAPAVALPTPDPLLATIASTQYFPEGATATGLTDQVDVVNPGSSPAHVQVRLLTDTGWTSLTRYALPAHSRKSVNLAALVGTNQSIATLVQADQVVVSGRQIVRQSASGSYSVGTAATATHWYFADGYTVGSFDEFLTFVNPGVQPAHVHIHLVSDQGDVRDAGVTVGPAARTTIRVGDLLPEKAVSAIASSDQPVVAERTQIFANGRAGLGTAVGATQPLTSGYIDPGHLPAKAQGHFSLLNPSHATAHVQVTLINQKGSVTRRRTLQVPAGHRATIDLTADYGTANLGALITSDVGIVAEKVAYFGQYSRSHVGSSNLVATAAPAAHLVFPGGTTAQGADDFIGLYNAATSAASATVTVLYGRGQSVQRTVSVPAQGRISVNIRSLGVPGVASSVLVDGLQEAPFYATQTILNAAHTDGSEVLGVPFTAQ